MIPSHSGCSAARKDQMGETITTIETANTGIETIVKGQGLYSDRAARNSMTNMICSRIRS